jgi:hypothetical protein
MRLILGTTVINVNGVPQTAPVALNLTAAPYVTEGFAGVYLGSKGSGKSNVGAVVAEQVFAAKIPFIYFDRGSDAFGLKELGASVITFGSLDNASEKRTAMRDVDQLQDRPYAYKVARSVLELGYSLVVDCSVQMRHDIGGDLNKDGLHNHPLASFSEFINALYSVGQQLRHPCMVVVDEAHYFCPQRRSIHIQKLSTDALSVFSHDSRKAGIGTLLLTQRNAAISKSVIFDASVRIFGKMSYHNDYKAVREYAPDLEYHQLSNLRTGDAYLVGPRGTVLIHFNLRQTEALGDTPAFKSTIVKHPDGSDFATQTDVSNIRSKWEKI